MRAWLISLENKNKSPGAINVFFSSEANGKYPIFTIVACMSCLKVPHFVEATQHDAKQCDACRDRSGAIAVLVADSLNYTRAIYSNSLGAAQNSLQPV